MRSISRPVALIMEYRPMSANLVIFENLLRELLKKVNIEGVMLIPSKFKETAVLPEELSIKKIYYSKTLKIWRVSRKLRNYSIYHFIATSRFSSIAARRHPSIFTVYDLMTLKGIVPRGKRSRENLRRDIRYLNDVDIVHSISDVTRDDLCDIAGIDRNRIEVIHIGVDLTTYKVRDKAEARRLLGLPPKSPIVLNVGNEWGHKNTKRLFTAFSKVLKEVPDALLVRIGHTNEEMSPLIQTLSLGEAVIRTGPLSGTPHLYYNAADVYVCPDLDTGFGMPNLEAMASGCPVATSKNGAFPEVVGDAALLFNPFSEEEMASSIVRLLKDDRLRRELITKGLERVKGFTWEKCADKIAMLYERLIGNG